MNPSSQHPAAAGSPVVPLRIGSLCTGYGGLDLAVMAAVDAVLVWCADNDWHASTVLAARFPGVVIGNGVVPEQAAAALPLLNQVGAVPGAPAPPDLTYPHQMSLDAGDPGRKASQACMSAAPGAHGRPAPTAAARVPQRGAEDQAGTVPVATNLRSPRSLRRAA